MSSIGADIPEPDWTQFRSSVRDELLSRSIQRDTAVRRWTGWAIRPAAAWALSLFLAVSITTITVLWKNGGPAESPVTLPAAVKIEAPVSDAAAEAINAGPERSLFQDAAALGAEQQEQFRQLLEAGDAGPIYSR